VKISCPNCAYTGNVKDDLIPEHGRNLKCPNCETSIYVRRKTTTQILSEGKIPIPGSDFELEKQKTKNPAITFCVVVAVLIVIGLLLLKGKSHTVAELVPSEELVFVADDVTSTEKFYKDQFILPYEGKCNCGETARSMCRETKRLSEFMSDTIGKLEMEEGITKPGDLAGREMPEDFWQAYWCVIRCSEDVIKTKPHSREELVALFSVLLAEQAMGMWYYYAGDMESAHFFFTKSCAYGSPFEFSEGCDMLKEVEGRLLSKE
jgi:predicted Zn finger-like uncharacterized protein